MNISKSLFLLAATFGFFATSCDLEGPELDPITVSGTIFCYDGSPMENVELVLQFGALEYTGMTGPDGGYSIPDVPSDIAYLVKIDYEDGETLDTEDLEMLKDYSLGGGIVLDDFQLVMIDLEGTGIPTFQVIAQVEDLITSNAVTPWHFATADYQVPSPLNPDGAGQAVTIWLDELDTVDDVVLDLIGVKVGDLNGSSCN